MQKEDFDQFRDHFFYLHGPIIVTPLLLKYMKVNCIQIVCEKAFMSITSDFAFD